MSLETQIAALVTAANALTGSVNGKMAAIDAKVAQATDSVPSVIRGLAAQAFYIDAVDGNDTNTGLSTASPLKTAAMAATKAVNGGYVTLHFRTQQTHLVNFSMATGGLRCSTYGSGDITNKADRATLRPAPTANLEAGTGMRIVQGVGVTTGQVFFYGVNLACDYDEVAFPGPPRMHNSFIRYADSSMSVLAYNCHILIGNVSYISSFSGYSSRDMYFSSVEIELKAGSTQKLFKALNGTPNTYRLDASTVTLINVAGGWADLLPTKGMDNVLTNIAF